MKYGRFWATLRLLAQAWDGRRAVRLVGVGVSGFGERYEQLRLWDDASVVDTQSNW